ncbi:hypothetical protein BH24DEI2_BH24DEI2_16000 [soil metagenome]
MAAFHTDLSPTVFFKQFDEFTNFHLATVYKIAFKKVTLPLNDPIHPLPEAQQRMSEAVGGRV